MKDDLRSTTMKCGGVFVMTCSVTAMPSLSVDSWGTQQKVLVPLVVQCGGKGRAPSGLVKSNVTALKVTCSTASTLKTLISAVTSSMMSALCVKLVRVYVYVICIYTPVYTVLSCVCVWGIMYLVYTVYCTYVHTYIHV